MSIVRFYWSYSTDGRSFFVLRGSRGGDPPPAAPAGNHLILWGATTRRATVLPCRLVILSRRRRIRMLPSPGDEGTDPSACGLRMTENGCASPVPGRPLIRPCGAPSPPQGGRFCGRPAIRPAQVRTKYRRPSRTWISMRPMSTRYSAMASTFRA